jgi:hypothetical protein
MNTTAEENNLVTFSGRDLGMEARDIENFIPLNRGGQRKTKGFQLYKAVGNKPIQGIYRYKKANGDDYFLIASDGKLYRLLEGVLTTLYSAFSTSNALHFETAQDLCVLSDGAAAPQVFDGSSVAALGGGPPTGARQTLYYQNRLWVFSQTNNQSLLYYSDAGNIAAGYASNFINCDNNDGQKITAISKFFIPGQLQPVILVGKERSVGMVVGDGSTADPYTFIKVNQDAGIPGFRQMVQFGQDVAYLTPKGVSSFQTDQSNVNLTYRLLSDKIRTQFQQLNSSALKDAIAFYDWLNERLGFAVPEVGFATPNVIYYYDIRLACWYKERWHTGQDCSAMWVDADGKLYHGDTLGNVYLHDNDGKFNASQINGYYRSPYLDFGAPHQYKRIVEARAILRGEGSYTAGVSYRFDYGTKEGATSILNVSGGSYLWKGGVWTASTATYRWGASPIKLAHFYPSGVFRTLQFTLSQSGSNQPLDWFEMQFDVEFLNMA